MYTDDNGIVRFEESDNVSPLHTALNTALQSVSNSYDVQSDDIEAVVDRVEALEDDTGWQPIPSINSNFESYGVTQVPLMKRSGGWVTLRGAFRCTTANHIVGTGQQTMATLPDLYRPETDSRLLYVNGVMQGSGSNQWYLGIYDDGRMTASRYTATTHNTNLWLPFHIVYEGKPVS